MDANLFDQPIPHYKLSHLRNPMKTHQSSISRSCHNSLPTDISSMGLLQAPPLSLFGSYRPFSLQKPPQPPLLPLPATHLRRSSSCVGPSCFPANRNGNRTTGHAFSPKKSIKSPTKIPKKEDKKKPKRFSETATVSLTSNSGSNSKEQPKNIAKAVEDQEDMVPGSVMFTISPPPSSLPLPTFSLRPKLSCNAVVAGVDTGATDNLRRLLRLQ